MCYVSWPCVGYVSFDRGPRQSFIQKSFIHGLCQLLSGGWWLPTNSSRVTKGHRLIIPGDSEAMTWTTRRGWLNGVFATVDIMNQTKQCGGGKMVLMENFGGGWELKMCAKDAAEGECTKWKVCVYYWYESSGLGRNNLTYRMVTLLYRMISPSWTYTVE